MKVLFATMPFDGHFVPLTGIAAHLLAQGHDVRWYAAPSYQPRLCDLGIRAVPFERAIEVNGTNIHALYPERAQLKGPRLLAFDGDKIFAANVTNHFEDIKALRQGFPFDALFCDAAFFAAKLVAEKLPVTVYAVGVGPTLASSRDVPPPFFGLRPARGLSDKVFHRGVRALLHSGLRRGLRTYNAALTSEGLQPISVKEWFDVPYRCARHFFQDGVAALDYPRSDLPPNVTYVGALRPHRPSRSAQVPLPHRSDQHQATVVVSQGTVDNDDPSKLIVPTLEALKDQPYLIVATTGGSQTHELRRRYPQDNIVIEDFLDFQSLFHVTDVFVCNGGYGSVMAALGQGVPVLAAGKREGKNDINARLDHLGYGIDLKTERPTAEQIAHGVRHILEDRQLTTNVTKVQADLATHDPLAIIDKVLQEDGVVASPSR